MHAGWRSSVKKNRAMAVKMDASRRCVDGETESLAVLVAFVTYRRMRGESDFRKLIIDSWHFWLSEGFLALGVIPGNREQMLYAERFDYAFRAACLVRVSIIFVLQRTNNAIVNVVSAVRRSRIY